MSLCVAIHHSSANLRSEEDRLLVCIPKERPLWIDLSGTCEARIDLRYAGSFITGQALGTIELHFCPYFAI